MLDNPDRGSSHRPHDETQQIDTTDETEKREITAVPHHHVVCLGVH
jgi:hypothetical protein